MMNIDGNFLYFKYKMLSNNIFDNILYAIDNVIDNDLLYKYIQKIKKRSI